PVSQHQTNSIQRNPVTEHLRRRGVPQRVGALGRGNNTGALHRASHHSRNAVATQKWSEWGNASDEYAIAPLRSGATPDVVNDCVPNLLRQRQPNLITSLPRDAQCTGLPFDVTKPESRDIAGAKPQP